jgi:hypothetical protein
LRFTPSTEQFDRVASGRSSSLSARVQVILQGSFLAKKKYYKVPFASFPLAACSTGVAQVAALLLILCLAAPTTSELFLLLGAADMAWI